MIMLDFALTPGLLHEAIDAVAKTHRILTVDDVWRWIGGPPLSRAEASKIGPAMQTAQYDGIIEPVPGQFIRSKRPEAHGNLMQVWRSKVY